MADWSWESANASSSQQASPIQSSPLQSSSSQSSHEATVQRTSQECSQPPVDAPRPGSARANTSRISLVETLQTCLTTSRPSSSLSDAQPTTSRSVSSTTSTALGPTKPSKRRSRASRRVPTTVLDASSSDFRDTVQRLTGIPAISPAPVRPLPQRASPTTFIRPDRPLLAAPVSRPAAPAGALDFVTPTTPLASNSARFDEFLPPWHRSSSDLARRRELEAGNSFVAPYSVSGSITTTRPLPGPTSSSWADSAQVSFPSTSLVSNEIIATSEPPNPAGLILLPEENIELSMSQLDDWLSGDNH